MSRFVPATLFAPVLFASVLLVAAPAAAQQAPGLSMPQAMSAAPAPGSQVVPRRTAEVSGEFVRLGDLFTGLGGQADTVVAYAPTAGETMVFDHARLTSLAAEHGIVVQTLGGVPPEVAVSRAADTVTVDHVRAALRDALMAEGVTPGSEIELTTAVRPVAVAVGTLNPIAVSEVQFDRRNGRFSAMVEMPVGAPNATRQRVSGQAYETIEVPVVLRPVNRDAVITDADIDWIKMRADRLQPGIATDSAEVIGMAARRSVRAGEPLRLRDLARPTLVARNELVTMVLTTSFMTLTSRGRALENGAIGDIVRIRNERSNKTVLGRVVDARTVVVEGAENSAAIVQ
ncbi:MAG: flagellar basal body P-ring formation chaperone FlgA [Rhodospirillaceae bacterium]